MTVNVAVQQAALHQSINIDSVIQRAVNAGWIIVGRDVEIIRTPEYFDCHEYLRFEQPTQDGAYINLLVIIGREANAGYTRHPRPYFQWLSDGDPVCQGDSEASLSAFMSRTNAMVAA